MRRTCASSTAGCRSVPALATRISSASGMLAQRKYESRDASSMSLTGYSSTRGAAAAGPCDVCMRASTLPRLRRPELGPRPRIRFDAEQEIRRCENRLQRQADALVERIAFALRKRDEIELRLQLFVRHRAPIGALHQAAQDRPRALRSLLAADEDLLVALGRRGARIERPDDVEVIDEEPAAHVGIDVLQRAVEVRQLRVRRTDEALARLHGRTRRELALRISERAGAFDDRRDHLRAVDRQYQLARRRGLSRGFVARLQFFGRRLTTRRSTRPSASRRRRGPRRLRRLSPARACALRTAFAALRRGGLSLRR